MQIGFIGLGRMGSNMVSLLTEKGHDVVAYDIDEAKVAAAEEGGARGARSAEELCSALETPRFIWIMVQSGVVPSVLEDVMPHLSEGDTVVDGGNTYYEKTLERAKDAQQRGIHFIDCGVSGGTERARTGATLMVGGPQEIVERYEQVFKDLAMEDGYGYMGSTGAGHYVKMVHNGIEYGMIQAIAEGLEAIHGARDHFGTDIDTVLRVYNHGSIIESELTRWAWQAWRASDGLQDISGEVPKGDTEEEMEQLTEQANMPVLKAALQARKQSREDPSLYGKVTAAIRNAFGSHPMNTKDDT